MCASCESILIAEMAHGMVWCSECFTRVQTGDAWQADYRATNPDICDHLPGAAACAYLMMLSGKVFTRSRSSSGNGVCRETRGSSGR